MRSLRLSMMPIFHFCAAPAPLIPTSFSKNKFHRAGRSGSDQGYSRLPTQSNSVLWPWVPIVPYGLVLGAYFVGGYYSINQFVVPTNETQQMKDKLPT